LKVPEALLSGDHARIKEFRTKAAMDKCRRNRPDLLASIEALEDEDN
jgi:tRNA (guanine37-N1)-methyltransferase